MYIDLDEIPKGLRNFINWAYKHSKIKKENVFHYLLFKDLFLIKDKMTQKEIKREVKEIGEKAKDSNFIEILSPAK